MSVDFIEHLKDFSPKIMSFLYFSKAICIFVYFFIELHDSHYCLFPKTKKMICVTETFNFTTLQA